MSYSSLSDFTARFGPKVLLCMSLPFTTRNTPQPLSVNFGMSLINPYEDCLEIRNLHRYIWIWLAPLIPATEESKGSTVLVTISLTVTIPQAQCRMLLKSFHGRLKRCIADGPNALDTLETPIGGHESGSTWGFLPNTNQAVVVCAD